MLGYIIGPAALGLLAGSGGVAIAVALMAALATAGAVGWSILRRRRHVASQVPGAATTEGDGSATGRGPTPPARSA